MKSNKRYIAFNALYALLFISLFSLQSCKDSDSEGAMPIITMVTEYTTPDDKTPLEGAFPETLILITGENLSGVTSVTFNGYPGFLRTPYVTDTHIVIQVPKGAPNAATIADGEVVPDELAVNTNGGKAVFPFQIMLPKPTISAVRNEFTQAGKECVIYGSYLYKISKIIVPNGTETGIEVSGSDILENTADELTFIMPQGASKGRLMVENSFGKAKSRFNILDNTYVMMDFDNVVPTGNLKGVVADDADGNGSTYYKCAGIDAGFAWRNDIMIRPEFQGKDFSKGYLKFEFRSANPLKDSQNKSYIQLQLTSMDDGFDLPLYQYSNGNWKPYQMDEYVEKGFHEPEWKTLVFPITGFPGFTKINSFGRIVFDFKDVPSGIAPLDWSFDNVRFAFDDVDTEGDDDEDDEIE